MKIETKSRRIVPVAALILSTCQLFTSPQASGQQAGGLKSGIYLQDVMEEVKLPSEAGRNVLKLFKQGNTVKAVTTEGVFLFRDNRWTSGLQRSGLVTAAADPKGVLWLASSREIIRESDKAVFPLPGKYENDTILSLLPLNEGTLLAGTTQGLFLYDGKWNGIPITMGKRVKAIATDTQGDIWVATGNGLFRTIRGNWVDLDDNIMAYGLRRSYFSLESDTSGHRILFGGLFAVGCIAENGDNWILRGADGLPFGPVTTIRNTGDRMWLGTHKGAIMKDEVWHYFNGKRWLPDNKVNDILPLSRNTVWIATAGGISQIRETEMTLEEKAGLFEERIASRHDRYGLVSDSRLLKPGDLSTSQTVPNDNDGLWTSIYLAAECFRYAVTKDEHAKANAIKAFLAMEKLETVTAIPGFPARSYVAAGESTGEGGEWHLSADGKWKWKGDTSSDEIVGHMFAYPLFYDLVAEGEMKDRARAIVDRIMTHITDNNFHLIDLDGKPTRWGVWTPDSLNGSVSWMYEKGINSLQILSFLKAAYHVTGNPKYNKIFSDLVKNHHYADNMVLQKMYGPFDINHSDDELAFLPYYILFRYADDPGLLPVFNRSMMRSWRAERADRIPIWNIIASSALKEDCDLPVALEELQLIPMDLVTWSMENSHRWDLPEDQLTDRFGRMQAVKPVPTPERGISKWNFNTYQYDSGNGGYSEDDGAYFLLPYWMGRYHGFFSEEKSK